MSTFNNTSTHSQSQTFSELVEAFQSLFRGRTDVHGELYNESNPDEPKYSTKKDRVTLHDYRLHLKGQRWLGIHPLVGDKCSFAAVDLDEHDFQKAVAIQDTIQEFGLKAYIAETKHKGYRILTFFNEPQLAKDVRLVLRAVNEKLKIACEVFPMQDSLPPGSLKDGEIGSFINLPYFGQRCPFLTGNNESVSLEFALSNIKFNTEEHLRRALEKIPLPRTLAKAEAEEKLGHTPEEIVGMLRQPLAVGERRPTLVKLVGYLRYRGIPEEVAVALLMPWAEKCFTESLSQEEIESHIHGIYRRYGLRESKLNQVLNSKALVTILPNLKRRTK